MSNLNKYALGWKQQTQSNMILNAVIIWSVVITLSQLVVYLTVGYAPLLIK